MTARRFCLMAEDVPREDRVIFFASFKDKRL